MLPRGSFAIINPLDIQPNKKRMSIGWMGWPAMLAVLLGLGMSTSITPRPKNGGPKRRFQRRASDVRRSAPRRIPRGATFHAP